MNLAVEQADRRRSVRLRRGEAIAIACVLVLVFVIGWSRWYDPFSGDQALFLIGAEKLRAGGVMYRDFWDIKQPGVFVFFLLGGGLFGFDQVGEHVADLAWQLGFAVALFLGLRACFERYAFLAAFAALTVAGAYYAGSSSWHLLQVEELVGLPVFSCAWLLLEGFQRKSRRLAIAGGICGGLVLAFKLLFIVVLAALVSAVVVAVRATVPGTVARSMLTWWLAGLLAPVIVVVVYAVVHAAAATTLDTMFVVPVQVLFTADMHAPLARLADSATRFVLYYRGIIVLALIGLLASGGANASAKAWRLICVAWLASGAAVIVLQISSWWQYHFLLLIPPVGILAALGLEALVRSGSANRRSAALALVLGGVVSYVAVPLPQGAIATVVRVVRERPFASAGALERYRIATNGEYADARRDATLALAHAGSGPLYVFGDPLIYLDSGTIQSIAMSSWGIQLFTPQLWTRTVSELCARPPRYVFLFDGFVGRLESGDSGAPMSLLRRDYAPAERTRDGEWFRLVGHNGNAGVCPGIAQPMESARTDAPWS